MSKDVLYLTQETFDAALESPEPVLVDFWAEWCGPCRMVGPTIEQLATEYKGKAKVCKVNVDEQPVLAERYQIMTIPTVIVFKGGQAVEKVIGVKPKQTFAGMLDKHL
ncbi:MAG TPA: thioredoxin [Clostridia bacterium]|nr:thioredoxin [Clostridia bacterium]